MAVWSFAYCVWLSVKTPSAALFWSKMLNLGATFIPIFYLHWILSILNLSNQKKYVLYAGYAFTFFCAALSFSPLYITSVKPVLDFPYWPQAGILYILFLIFGYFGLTVYGLILLLKMRKGQSSERTHQLNYLLIGSIFGFGGGATNFPLMFGISLFPPIGQSVVVFYIIIFGLATLRYHLFEIKIILTEMLVGIMGVIITILFFLMPTTSLKLLTGIILLLFGVFGYYLIIAIHKEVAQKEEVERISKLKSEFISIASHQLRTPLAAIRGYTSMLKDNDFGKIPPEASQAVNYIHESSIGMIKLVNSLLSVSRLEKGQVELKLEDISVEKVVDDCIKDVELLAKEKKLYLKYKKPKNPLPTISADSEKLKQAISNIINNACLYTLKGGVSVTLSVQRNKIVLLVKDTGVGIEKDDFDKIFKSFSRGKDSAQLYTQGTGLGLYVAKNFIEMHNGHLFVDSEGKNKGSTFTIELPIKSVVETKHNFVLSEEN